LFDPYNYPHEPLRDEAGEIITDEDGEWVFEQDEAGNPTLTWPFPRKSSSFDPASVQIRMAYFYFGDGRQASLESEVLPLEEGGRNNESNRSNRSNSTQ